MQCRKAFLLDYVDSQQFLGNRLDLDVWIDLLAIPNWEQEKKMQNATCKLNPHPEKNPL